MPAWSSTPPLNPRPPPQHPPGTDPERQALSWVPSLPSAWTASVCSCVRAAPPQAGSTMRGRRSGLSTRDRAVHSPACVSDGTMSQLDRSRQWSRPRLRSVGWWGRAERHGEDPRWTGYSQAGCPGGRAGPKGASESPGLQAGPSGEGSGSQTQHQRGRMGRSPRVPAPEEMLGLLLGGRCLAASLLPAGTGKASHA